MPTETEIQTCTNGKLGLHNEFRALMEEEDRIVQDRVPGDWCYAYVSCPEPGEFGCWVENRPTESIHERFEFLATKAGIALGSPPGTSPNSYFLRQLFHDLSANNSTHIRICSDTAAIIERVFEAAATYCARLDRQWLTMSYQSHPFEGKAANQREAPAEKDGDATPKPQEAVPPKPPQPPTDTAETGAQPSPRRGPKPNYETALRVEKVVARVAREGNWRSQLDDICIELDEEAIPRPKTWKERGHHDWLDALRERPLVEKAITHHLKLARHHRKTFS